MEPNPLALIVEDEFLVRVFAVDIAEEAGFSAVEAADADEALRVLQKRLDIRVVLTDIDVPATWTAWSSPKPSEAAGLPSKLL